MKVQKELGVLPLAAAEPDATASLFITGPEENPHGLRVLLTTSTDYQLRLPPMHRPEVVSH